MVALPTTTRPDLQWDFQALTQDAKIKFGFPPATLRNWEQGRSRPDALTWVLLAVVAKHPEGGGGRAAQRQLN